MALGGLQNSHNAFKKTIAVVVAATKDQFGIGKNGKLPWRLPGDLKYFKKLTSTTTNSDKKNVVIMGRKTWESIPTRFRPLIGRINVVLSRNDTIREKLILQKDVMVASSLNDAFSQIQERDDMQHDIESVFVIGGQSIYEQALQLDFCRKVYLTLVHKKFDCDAFCPIPKNHDFQCTSASKVHNENDIQYEFQLLEKNDSFIRLEKPLKVAVHEEYQYLELIKRIIQEGKKRVDRTGTGTLSIFGAQMRYSLRDDIFPLLTTKRVFWRGLAEELLWFISGDTNANTLKNKNIHIWDGNGSREYLDSIGLANREEGDLGPVYGFQWRHFGAEYKTMHDDYSNQGVDQLAQVIEKIKSNPMDRRILLTAWNPSALPEMALPPCHMFCQFYVADEELSCQMYQRSADMGLGVPFNIASYALLTRLLAQVTNLKPGEFIHVIGDAHVYLNHVDPLKEQLLREPREFPKLYINPLKSEIDDFVFDDFTLEGYNPHKAIKMEMSV